MANYPAQVKIGGPEWTEGKIEFHGANDFSIPLYYKGRPLMIQTESLGIIFGLLSYSYPNSALKNHSMAIGLPKSIHHGEGDELKVEYKTRELLDDMDKNLKVFRSDQIPD